MKLPILFLTLSLASIAHAEDSVVVTCSEDFRAVDGALEELSVMKTSDNNYKFRLLVKGSGMGGAYKKETAVGLSHCSFSEVNPGVGECIQRTSDGFRGANRLALAFAFSEDRDQLRATVYTRTTTSEEVTQEVSFDLSVCKITKRDLRI
jgi:hypothetical protein